MTDDRLDTLELDVLCLFDLLMLHEHHNQKTHGRHKPGGGPVGSRPGTLKAKTATPRYKRNPTVSQEKKSLTKVKAEAKKHRQETIAEKGKKANKGVDIRLERKASVYIICGCKCVWSGEDMSKWQIKSGRITLDHLTPHELGGPTKIWNLMPSTKSCNSSRQMKPMTEFSRKWPGSLQRAMRHRRKWFKPENEDRFEKIKHFVARTYMIKVPRPNDIVFCWPHKTWAPLPTLKQVYSDMKNPAAVLKAREAAVAAAKANGFMDMHGKWIGKLDPSE